MKRIASLAVGLAALTMAPGAMACGTSPTYLRIAPPDRGPEDAIVAEVEIDLSTPVSLFDRGARLRVRRMIQGEPAAFLIVPFSSCSDGSPGRLSGYIVAARVSREGDALVVRPVLTGPNMFSDLPVTAPGAR